MSSHPVPPAASAPVPAAAPAGQAPAPVDAALQPATHHESRKVTTLRLQEMKRAGEKISALTAYDFLTARLLDHAGIDVILVGDSASMVFAGNDTTLPMKMDEMLYHVRVVTKAVKRALVVADMPFMSYHKGADEALGNAGRLMQDGLAEAVKLEGGLTICPIVERLAAAGIPVMGHIGLQPQSIHAYGTYKTRGSEAEEAERIYAAGAALESAGAFAVVVEKVPRTLAARLTAGLRIPVIGIGAGPDCDGQILVTPDMLGMNTQFHPRFVRKYAKLSEDMTKAFRHYRKDVKDRKFPTEAESY
jgi:3-methyl-2-oxobutanoate hydroxymethyltransferase